MDVEKSQDSYINQVKNSRLKDNHLWIMLDEFKLHLPRLRANDVEAPVKKRTMMTTNLYILSNENGLGPL